MATKLTLTLTVDKSRNRVIFAESSSQFVEILLSFLSLPLGSIIRLTNKQPMGSLHKLFQSVENLDSSCFVSEACRSMLLRPLNSAAKQCSALPIICDDNSFAVRYGYICSYSCSNNDRLSFYAKDKCTCGMIMNRRVQLMSDAVTKNGNGCAFIVSDCLVVSLSSTAKTIELLAEFGIEDWNALETIHVDVTAEKIIELLKRLLVSDTPLTDVFLSGQNENKNISFKQSSHHNCNEKVPPTASKRIPVKLFLNEDENKLLFAEAIKEFVDLLVSFLTYPMSFVVNMLGGQSGIQCFDNLYKCIDSLVSAKCLENKEMIDMLLSPKLPTYAKLNNQLIKLDELPVTTQRYYMCRTDECNYDEVSIIPNFKCNGCEKITNKRLTLSNPKDNSINKDSTRGFMMSTSFMVTDDLIIKKLSPAIIVKDFLKAYGRMKERNVEIGEDEAFDIMLRACFTAGNVLTDALVGNKG